MKKQIKVTAILVSLAFAYATITDPSFAVLKNFNQLSEEASLNSAEHTEAGTSQLMHLEGKNHEDELNATRLKNSANDVKKPNQNNGQDQQHTSEESSAIESTENTDDSSSRD